MSMSQMGRYLFLAGVVVAVAAGSTESKHSPPRDYS